MSYLPFPPSFIPLFLEWVGAGIHLSFIYELIYWFRDSLIHSFLRSSIPFMHTFLQFFIQQLVYSLLPCFLPSLLHTEFWCRHWFSLSLTRSCCSSFIPSIHSFVHCVLSSLLPSFIPAFRSFNPLVHSIHPCMHLFIQTHSLSFIQFVHSFHSFIPLVPLMKSFIHHVCRSFHSFVQPFNHTRYSIVSFIHSLIHPFVWNHLTRPFIHAFIYSYLNTCRHGCIWMVTYLRIRLGLHP